MQKVKQFLRVFGFLSPILFCFLVAIIAAIYMGYRPFHSLLK